MHHLAICSLTDGRWSIHYIPVSGGIWSYGRPTSCSRRSNRHRPQRSQIGFTPFVSQLQLQPNSIFLLYHFSHQLQLQSVNSIFLSHHSSHQLQPSERSGSVAEMSSCPSFAYVVAVNVVCSIASTNHRMWEDKKKRIKGMQKKQVYVLFKKERNQIFVPFFSEEKDIWWGRESLQCSLRAKRMELSFSEYLNNFNFDQIYIK